MSIVLSCPGRSQGGGGSRNALAPRRGSRIQKGGGCFVHSEGGVSYRNFRRGSKLLQGPGQINKQNKIADSRRGGGSDDPPKKPVSAHGPLQKKPTDGSFILRVGYVLSL